jgi:hypothetical protein
MVGVLGTLPDESRPEVLEGRSAVVTGRGRECLAPRLELRGDDHAGNARPLGVFEDLDPSLNIPLAVGVGRHGGDQRQIPLGVGGETVFLCNRIPVVEFLIDDPLLDVDRVGAVREVLLIEDSVDSDVREGAVSGGGLVLRAAHGGEYYAAPPAKSWVLPIAQTGSTVYGRGLRRGLFLTT